MEPGSTRPSELPVTPQAGALVTRARPDGAIECVVVTANAGGWTIPKGLIDPGMTPTQMAEIEALEEAGVIGRARPAALGRYSYEKWGGLCEVTIYHVPLDRELERWAEQDTRERRWVTLDEAAGLMKYDALAELLRELAARFERGELS